MTGIPTISLRCFPLLRSCIKPACALPAPQIVGWVGVAAMSLCIVMSRKHYSVDVVVAWYTVPLVFYAMHRRWTTKRPVQDYWPHRPLPVSGQPAYVNVEDPRFAARLSLPLRLLLLLKCGCPSSLALLLGLGQGLCRLMLAAAAGASARCAQCS